MFRTSSTEKSPPQEQDNEEERPFVFYYSKQCFFARLRLTVFTIIKSKNIDHLHMDFHLTSDNYVSCTYKL